jgi:hypothetical protein
MAYKISRVSYFCTIVDDQPGEALKILSQVAGFGIDLVAFSGIPIEPMRVELTLFPADPSLMQGMAETVGIELDGPYPALLVQGDDVLGSVSDIHEKLFRAKVNVNACSGVADGRGGYGYVLFISPDDFDQAIAALEIE